MIFHKAKDYRSAKEQRPKLFFNGEEIELVENFKYLGINLDTTLSYKFHCSQIEIKLNLSLAKMYTIRRMINEKFLKSVISAYLISIVDYGILFWSISNNEYVNKFQKKINRFVICYYYPVLYRKSQISKVYNSQINVFKLLNKINLLTINERQTLTLLKFTFKKMNSKLFGELFDNWFNISERSTSEFLPRMKILDKPLSTQYQQCIKWKANAIWNLYYKKLNVIMSKNIDECKTKLEIFSDACKLVLLDERNNLCS